MQKRIINHIELGVVAQQEFKVNLDYYRKPGSKQTDKGERNKNGFFDFRLKRALDVLGQDKAKIKVRISEQNAYSCSHLNLRY